MIGWLLGALSMAGSVYSLGSVLDGHLAPALVAHMASGLLGGWGAARMRASLRGSGWYECVIAWCIPCAGGPLVWLQAAGEALSPKGGEVAKEFTEYLDAAMRMGEAQLPTDEHHLPPSPELVVPMADVLRSDSDPDEKRNAIEALSRVETPDAVETLRSALTGDSTEVRFYAASALSRLEERLAARMKALENDLAKGLRDRGLVALELARTSLDYGYYRLTDETRRIEFLERAARHADEAVQRSRDPEAFLIAGRAMLELARHGDAERMFSRFLDRVGDDAKGLLWRAEARFRQGRYAGVRDDCRRARAAGGVPEVLADVVGMWA